MTAVLEYEDLRLVKPDIFLHVVKREEQVGAGTWVRGRALKKQPWVVAAAPEEPEE